MALEFRTFEARVRYCAQIVYECDTMLELADRMNEENISPLMRDVMRTMFTYKNWAKERA